MKIPFFDLKRQNESIASHINEAITEVFDSGQFILGGKVSAFEAAFAAYTGSKNCITCGNGTDALELSLQSLGVGEGDEVIVPAFGWVSPALAVNRVGADPVFADIESNGFNVSASTISPFINKNTKAVVIIHLYGNVCDINSIVKLCNEHGLLLIEDCAQAHGARVNGKHVGLFGDIGIFSFYPTKNLGCLGDGGCVITNNDEIAHRIAQLGNYGRSNNQFQIEARNSRLDELQAALLLKKLPMLNQWNDRRREIATIYDYHIKEKLGGKKNEVNSVFYQYPLLSENRQELKKYLREKGIETDIHYPFTIPMALSLSSHGQFPNAQQASEQVLSLPIFPELSNEEVFYIARSVQNFTVSTN